MMPIYFDVSSRSHSERSTDRKILNHSKILYLYGKMCAPRSVWSRTLYRDSLDYELLERSDCFKIGMIWYKGKWD